MNVINEEKYGCIQELSLFTPEGEFVYSVGKKYPLPLDDNAEGEALMMGSCFQINILWSNILEEETKFLHGLCKGLSIYKDPVYDIVFLGFIFSHKPVIVSVTEEEVFVQDWINCDYDATGAYFFLTEATNKEILQIRNIGFQKDYIIALKKMLINYKKPSIDTIRKCVPNTNTSIIFNKAKFRWVYSQAHDEFLFIPEEIETHTALLK